MAAPEVKASDPIGTREGVVWLLREIARLDATEVHIKAPGPVTARVDGVLMPFGPKTLTPSDARDAAFALAELSGRDGGIAAGTEVEFSFGLAGIGRFHTCLYHQRGSLAAFIRRVSLVPPSLTLLGAPEDLAERLLPGRILALVGPERLDWQHALIHQWNHTRDGYVVSIERPLLYLHRDAMSGVAQREVGQDVRDAATGIRLAARLHADLIACSDLSEAETVDAALAAAEHGRRVLVVLPGPTVEGIPDWLAQRYPATSRSEMRPRLESVLFGIDCKRR